jgi:hypothetical protein
MYSGAIVIIMLCATWGHFHNNFTIDINRSDTRIMKSFCCTRIEDYVLLCVYYLYIYSMMQNYNGGGVVHDWIWIHVSKGVNLWYLFISDILKYHGTCQSSCEHFFKNKSRSWLEGRVPLVSIYWHSVVLADDGVRLWHDPFAEQIATLW